MPLDAMIVLLWETTLYNWKLPSLFRKDALVLQSDRPSPPVPRNTKKNNSLSPKVWSVHLKPGSCFETPNCLFAKSHLHQISAVESHRRCQNNRKTFDLDIILIPLLEEGNKNYSITRKASWLVIPSSFSIERDSTTTVVARWYQSTILVCYNHPNPSFVVGLFY